MMEKNLGGRPPYPGDKRDQLVAIYLTADNAGKLKKLAKAGGFKGMSTMITAILEPIIDGGFSVEAAARSINRVQKFAERNGAKLFRVTLRSLLSTGRDMLAPPPAIPDDVEDISQLIADLRKLLNELENQTNKPTDTK